MPEEITDIAMEEEIARLETLKRTLKENPQAWLTGKLSELDAWLLRIPTRQVVNKGNICQHENLARIRAGLADDPVYRTQVMTATLADCEKSLSRLRSEREEILRGD